MNRTSVFSSFLAGVVMLGGAQVQAGKTFRAGAAAMDVTPTNLPIIVNGGFMPRWTEKIYHPLNMRWMVLDDGDTRLAMGVLDTCMFTTEFANEIKVLAEKATGIPAGRIMISATHTHSAPSLAQALGTPPDPAYVAFVTPRIIECLRRAVAQLAPARVGWTSVQAPDHTHTRVWIRRPDKMLNDPFGKITSRAHMHPGYENPDAIGPAGPSDPEMVLLAVQSPQGRPVAVFASYAMHYFGAAPISSDYFGFFASKLGPLIGADTTAQPAFVGIMAQGTSGDQHHMDYRRPKAAINIDMYATQLAQLAADAYKKIRFKDWAPLAMREQIMTLATRQPDAERLAWAQGLVDAMGAREPKDRIEVYAREQFWLKEHPTRAVTIQAIRVGDLGIATWPCEAFALNGLQVKEQSPFALTMNIELANGGEGYILSPELFPLGGYNTWPCRTAGLEETAAIKMADALLGLLENVGGKARRPHKVTHGSYAQAVLASKPMAYWRMEDWGGFTAADATRAQNHATYQPCIARWLDGPASPAFSGNDTVNRCVHLAGGHLLAKAKDLKTDYTATFWFWNGISNDLRSVTGVLFSRGKDTLAIGGKDGAAGRLSLGTLTGTTAIAPRTWNHAALVRAGERVAVYLNGCSTPELAGDFAADLSEEIHIGGAQDASFTLEGKIDEVALYSRALSSAELQRHYQKARHGEEHPR